MPARTFQGSLSFPQDARPALTIGNFDGVHRGHQSLLARLTERARALGVPSCVYTFEPPPRRVLQPDRCPPRMTSLRQKIELLHGQGVDLVVVEDFTIELASRPAEWFAREILGARLRPSALVVGYDFRFGRGRQGDADALAAWMPELSIEAVRPFLMPGEDRVVSSSAVREAVAAGDVTRAAALLGRPYAIEGVVIHGDARGRTIGFPTANLQTDAELLPAPGVYAVDVDVVGGAQGLRGVANLGVRPTFGKLGFTIEAHLLNFAGDLYGETLSMRLLKRLRGEERFAGASRPSSPRFTSPWPPPARCHRLDQRPHPDLRPRRSSGAAQPLPGDAQRALRKAEPRRGVPRLRRRSPPRRGRDRRDPHP
ncbi:MAG: riboflavin biosynthesis protein RibF [Deltaproteobacteria bacterium]|nr:riboflavin biosynthesis protein RibF [Deltaproteobacteria bacterium]